MLDMKTNAGRALFPAPASFSGPGAYSTVESLRSAGDGMV